VGQGLTAAVVIVALMFVLSVVVARAQESTVARLQASAPAIKRWGGAVLLAIGAWFIVLDVFADTFADLFPV
jgi:protein-S-isoprenylcysteine O-methyltransferase Ste14